LISKKINIIKKIEDFKMPCIDIPLRNFFYDVLFNLAYAAGFTKDQIIDCQIKIFTSSAYPSAGCPDNGITNYKYSVFKIHTKCDYFFISHDYDGVCIIDGEGYGPWNSDTYPGEKTTIYYSLAYSLANIVTIMTNDCVGAGNYGSAELCGQASRQWICYKEGVWNEDYEPPEPPEPPPEEYEWDEEYNNIDCQAESFPGQTTEQYPSQLLDNLMNAICCSPRPCFLICTNYNEELVADPYIFSIQFRLELYFPLISGSIALLDGEPLVARCLGHQYVFVYSVVDPLVDTGQWQENIHRFVENFNFINQQKLTIMLAGYGLTIQEQNEEKDEANYIDIDCEIVPAGKKGERYSFAVDVIKKVFSYLRN